MAHQIAGRALWNRKNRQQQGLLISHPRYSDIINNKRPNLVSTIQPAALWPHLQKYNVLGESLQDKLTLNSTRSETVEKLLNHVERGPTWQLHSFLRACNLTDQGHIIREIGLDPEVYDGPSPPGSDSEDDSHPAAVSVEDPPQKVSDSIPKHSYRLTADHSLGQQGEPSLPSKTHPDLLPSQKEDVRGQTCTQILIEALTVHAEYYRDNFMTGRIFDFKHNEAGSDFYDIEPCYMQQDVDVNKSRRSAEKIKMRDILRKYESYSVPKTVLLVGPTGAGKSTFFRRFAFCWSKELLKYLQDPGVHPCPDLSLVVYVAARSLTTDIWDSMERAVICKKDRQSLIISQIRNGQLRLSLKSSKPKLQDKSGTFCTTEDPASHSPDPESAFLIDGIDEIRDLEVLQALQDFIRQIHKEGGPQILVSARTGLSRMDNSIFSRFLHLEGYTLVQGLEYVEKYITQFDQTESRVPRQPRELREPREPKEPREPRELRKPREPREPTEPREPREPRQPRQFSELREPRKPRENQDCDITSHSTESLQDKNEHPVLAQLKKSTKKIMHILSNPLRAHILSGLTVEGLIELDDDNVLQSVELLKTMENFFIKRETEGGGVPEEERDRFYKLCLYGLIEDIRQFTEDHLQQFDVSTSAYISFLRKQTKMDKSANQVTYYSFEHELLYEYFAARAMETLPGGMRNAILLYICSRDILRNLQKLIFGMLGEFAMEQSVPLLIGMTQLILLKEALNKSQEYSPGQIRKSAAKSQNVSEDIKPLHFVSEDVGDRNCLSTPFQSIRPTCCYQGSLPVPSLESSLPASPQDPLDIDLTLIQVGDSKKTDTELWQAFFPSVQQLFQSIKKGIPAPGHLLHTKGAQDRLDLETAAAIWEMVEEMFVKLIELVKGETCQFWKNTYFSIDHVRFINKGDGFLREVVLDLLSELTPEQQEKVVKNTYLRMLPCNGAYACGDSRWLDVHRSRINTWSTVDVAAGLLESQLRLLHKEPIESSSVETSSGHYRKAISTIDINFWSRPSQWGCVPDDQWSRAAWDRALQAVTLEYDIEYKLEFHIPEYAPADGLLESISCLDKSAYSGRYIRICGGLLQLENLHQWHQSGNTQDRELTLYDTNIQQPVDEQIRNKILKWVGHYSHHIDDDPQNLSGIYYVSEDLIIDFQKG